uniref:helix-turn-helix domain-containing protein n=1 Tax=Faecalibacterium prausnitzii TaxID=853 RepID=UPI003FEE13E7
MFGDILRELRKDFRMTQAELAEKLSLSPLTISAYECGRSVPDDTTKVKIARIFNVSLDYLLGLIREPFPYDRSANTLLLPVDFTSEDTEKVQEYIQFLEYQKKNLSSK